MNMVILNNRQDRLLTELASTIADRASKSPLPYQEYLIGLERYILGSTEERRMVRRISGAMIEDERVILQILSMYMSQLKDPAAVKGLIDLLARKVKAEL